MSVEGRGGKNRSITVSSKRAADRLKIEVEDACAKFGRYDEPSGPREATPLVTVLTDFVESTLRTLAPGTAKNYAQHLDLFKRWVPAGSRVDVLSFELLGQYHSLLQSPVTGRHLHRRGATTIQKHFSAIELAWQFAWQRQARGDYFGVPQPDTLGLKRQQAPHKLAPSWADMDAAIGVSSGWLRSLYIVLRCSGLRVQQALGLRWEDLRLDADIPTLHIRPELGKSKQEKRGRFIPIAPVLVAELRTWGPREGFVIPCPRLEREARARDAQRAWTRAGVDPVLWAGCAHHAFRSGFTSGLKRLKADTEAVEFLVGHARGIRESYVGPDALPLVEAVRLVPPIADPVRTRSVQEIATTTEPRVRRREL